jgi:hypothetical protein
MLDFKQEYLSYFPDCPREGETWEFSTRFIQGGTCKILSLVRCQGGGDQYLCEYVNVTGNLIVEFLRGDQLTRRRLTEKEAKEKALERLELLLEYQKKSTAEWAAEAHKWYNKWKILSDEKEKR